MAWTLIALIAMGLGLWLALSHGQHVAERLMRRDPDGNRGFSWIPGAVMILLLVGAVVWPWLWPYFWG